jgi:hypothetical protein
MSFEYKTVGGPERGKRGRGLNTVAARVAAALEDIIRAEARDGWEYLRTDLVPVSERAGLFSRRQPMTCSVLVFRREIGHGGLSATQPAQRRPLFTPPRDPEPEARAVPPAPIPVLGVDMGRRVAARPEEPLDLGAWAEPAGNEDTSDAPDRREPPVEGRPIRGGQNLFTRRDDPGTEPPALRAQPRRDLRRD